MKTVAILLVDPCDPEIFPLVRHTNDKLPIEFDLMNCELLLEKNSRKMSIYISTEKCNQMLSKAYSKREKFTEFAGLTQVSSLLRHQIGWLVHC